MLLLLLPLLPPLLHMRVHQPWRRQRRGYTCSKPLAVLLLTREDGAGTCTPAETN